MTGSSRLTPYLVALVVFTIAACGGKEEPETEPRERTEPPPPVEEPVVDDSAERAAEEERLARERAYGQIGEMIFFEFDKSDLKDDSREVLRQKSEILRSYPDIRVRVEGHADERGTIEYNLALGERRAEAARQYLVDLGIDPDRLNTISYGEERPLIAQSNEAAWAQNRRDEFIPN